MTMKRPEAPNLISTGIEGLDEVLGGGLPSGRTYLIRGDSGTGKTTMALQFALEGAQRGETSLYIMLTETVDELEAVTRSHGWRLDGVHVHEVVERPERLMREARTTLFGPAEIELGAVIEEIASLAREMRPTRVAIDPISELRLMSEDPLRIRRQILALKQVFADIGATALLMEEPPIQADGGEHIENVAHGVLVVDQRSTGYGPSRRRLQVKKVRGLRYLAGYHDIDILTGGIEVYPRPVDIVKPPPPPFEVVSTMLPSLDDMLGGGLESGTTTMVMGPSGTGKSSLLSHLSAKLAEQGKTASIYLFEEGEALFRKRAENLDLPLSSLLDSGSLHINTVNPGDMSSGHLLQHIRRSVEKGGVRAIALDSLSGLARTVYDEPSLEMRLRETLSWLSRRGVNIFLSLSRHKPGSGLIGGDISYMADTVIVLHHVESGSKLGKAISILKRRGGKHDSSVRELRMSSKGLLIGEPVEGSLTSLALEPAGNGWAARQIPSTPKRASTPTMEQDNGSEQ